MATLLDSADAQSEVLLDGFLAQFDDELDDRAEHVQLNLLIRGVSDADRPGAGVSGE